MLRSALLLIPALYPAYFRHIFKLCAALLHIGNIKISAIRDEAYVQDDDPSLQQACRLLGLNQAEFKKWIVKKQIILRDEKIVSNLNQIVATTGRDSVAKFLYSSLFDWIVRVTNKNLYKESAAENTTFIGVLDIYGYDMLVHHGPFGSLMLLRADSFAIS